MGSSLNQRAAEFSLCNTLVLLLDLSFKQFARNDRIPRLFGATLTYADHWLR